MKADNYYKAARYEEAEDGKLKVASFIFPFNSSSPNSRKRALEELWSHPSLKGSRVSIWKKTPGERFPEIGAGL